MDSHVVCRTCYRQTKKYVSIFSAPELWGKNIVIAKLIMACAPIIIKIGDGLPSKICDNCLELLQLSFLFRLRVITANEHFKEIVQNQVLQGDRSSPLKNLNHIYSTNYIVESITVKNLRRMDSLKQEPLDIKEELIDTEESPSNISRASPSPRVTEKTQSQTQCNTLPKNPQHLHDNEKYTKTPEKPQNQTQSNTLPKNPQKDMNTLEKCQNQTQSNTLPKNPQHLHDHEKYTKAPEKPENQTQSNTLSKNSQSLEKNTDTLEKTQNQTQCNTLPKNPQSREKNTKTLENPQKQTQSNSLPKNPQDNNETILPEKTANVTPTTCSFKLYDSINKQTITVVKHIDVNNKEKRVAINNSNKNNNLSNETSANNTLNTDKSNNSNEENCTPDKKRDNSISNKFHIKRTYSKIGPEMPQVTKLPKIDVKTIKIRKKSYSEGNRNGERCKTSNKNDS